RSTNSASVTTARTMGFVLLSSTPADDLRRHSCSAADALRKDATCRYGLQFSATVHCGTSVSRRAFWLSHQPKPDSAPPAHREGGESADAGLTPATTASRRRPAAFQGR